MSNNETEIIDSDSIELNDVKVEGTFDWGSLITANNSISKDILTQQALTVELSNKFEDVLVNKPDTRLAIDGLVSSMLDIAKDVAKLQVMHNDSNGAFLKGDVVGNDEIIKYLKIGGAYIAAQENLANLMGTSYLDIFAVLTAESGIKNEMPTAVGVGK